MELGWGGWLHQDRRLHMDKLEIVGPHADDLLILEPPPFDLNSEHAGRYFRKCPVPIHNASNRRLTLVVVTTSIKKQQNIATNRGSAFRYDERGVELLAVQAMTSELSPPVLMQMRCQQLLLHRSSRHDRDALHFLLIGNQRNSSPQLIAASGTVLYNISAKPRSAQLWPLWHL